MNRLSCGVPVVISRWKPRSAPRLWGVLWTFATCVPGAARKRSASLQTKRTELVQVASANASSFVRRRVLCTSKSNNNGSL